MEELLKETEQKLQEYKKLPKQDRKNLTKKQILLNKKIRKTNKKN